MKQVSNLLAVYVLCISSSSTSEFREYCIQEEFEATCEEEEIILIQEARYGRMSVGRCVSADYGNLGCSADVTSYIDTKCSGRHHCKMTVKELIDVAQPCDKDFSSYLEVRQECVKVAFGTLEDCRDHNHVVLKSQTGYLSTLMTEETGYGLAGCPWRIKAQPGQNLELSVMDFNLLVHFQTGDDPYNEDYSGWCPVSIVIEEEGVPRKDIALCDGGQHRERHLYSSKSNELSVHFLAHQTQQPHYYFLVKYKDILPQNMIDTSTSRVFSGQFPQNTSIDVQTRCYPDISSSGMSTVACNKHEFIKF